MAENPRMAEDQGDLLVLCTSREERRELLEERGGPGTAGVKGLEEERVEAGRSGSTMEMEGEDERQDGTVGGGGRQGKAGNWLPPKAFRKWKKARARARVAEERRAVSEGRKTLAEVEAATAVRAAARRTQESNRAVKEARRDSQRVGPSSRAEGGGWRSGWSG